jgi:hypothetical protein
MRCRFGWGEGLGRRNIWPPGFAASVRLYFICKLQNGGGYNL